MPALACLFAHPDDETFAVGGTLAKYAAAGVRIDLFCATDGDAGKNAGVAVSSRAELGARRRVELRAAADVLGIRDIVCAGRGDGALATMDQEALVGDMVRFLRSHRPDVVITFGPEGAPTAHRDHRALSRAATSAYFLAAIETEWPEHLAEGLARHAASRLYYVAWDGAQGPVGRARRFSVAPTVRIDVRAQLTTKAAAFEAHETQHLSRPHFEALGMHDDELFALAAGRPNDSSDDLFAGL